MADAHKVKSSRKKRITAEQVILMMEATDSSGDEDDEVDDSNRDPDFIPDENAADTEVGDGDLPEDDPVPLEPDQPQQPGQDVVEDGEGDPPEDDSLQPGMPGDEADEVDDSERDSDFIPGPDDHSTDAEDQPQQPDQDGVDANNNEATVKRNKCPATETWNQNVCKKGRLEGKAYKNRKGQEKPAKKIGITAYVEEKDTDFLKQWLSGLPSLPSHYCRSAYKDKKFLYPGTTIVNLHEEYQAAAETAGN
ncbi:hypothetical protein SKAU_G00095650 [Synaphobranchus kaupii]|uniref:Uncharacterized protein n=1 Tax=Synaphobranchus kaupii TaxID=118154 RepID=A0A9Q1FXS5_SYNKA|nr:hypothetical protein SKAU_G00095650 [Synaphobranchus kaupii]